MERNVRKNINRGYMKLIVWQDAKALYVLTCKLFREFPYELKRVASQQIAAADSVHRNIAEGYARRSLNEYLNFLNIVRLIESLQLKRQEGGWDDSFVVRESNAAYDM